MKPEERMRLKELLPTSLGSAEIRERIAADILRRSVFSARMEFARHLAAIRDAVTQMLEGKIERGEAERLLLRSLAALGHPTEGESLTDPASERRLKLILDTQCQMAESVARLSQQTEAVAQMLEGRIERGEAERLLLRSLAALGHPIEGAESIADPASERRLKLVLDTQCQMAKSVAQLSQQTESVVHQFPGWELCRVGERRLPRKDWLSRWNLAGRSVGWEGAVDHPIYGDATAYGFLALKSSPIWAALGAGVGGFRDTLGNPFPPFAYSSGMDWLDADRETCERFGLVPGDADVPRGASLSPAEEEIREAALKVGFDL